MRSDDEELRSIEAEIDKGVDIEFLSTDTHVLSKLTVSKVAINTKFSSSKRASRHHELSEIPRDLKENSVIIIAVLIKVRLQSYVYGMFQMFGACSKNMTYQSMTSYTYAVSDFQIA